MGSSSTPEPDPPPYPDVGVETIALGSEAVIEPALAISTAAAENSQIDRLYQRFFEAPSAQDRTRASGPLAPSLRTVLIRRRRGARAPRGLLGMDEVPELGFVRPD